MPSPVRCDHHGGPHLTLGGWLFHYRWKTPGVRAADSSSVHNGHGQHAAARTASCSSRPNLGGGPKLTRTATSMAIPGDHRRSRHQQRPLRGLHDKLEAYRRNGVREYLVSRVPRRADRLVRPAPGRIRAARPGGKRDPAQHDLSRSVARPSRTDARGPRHADGRAASEVWIPWNTRISPRASGSLEPSRVVEI